MLIDKISKERLYKQILVSLGYPTVKVELEDEQMDVLFQNSIEEVTELVSDWTAKINWFSLYGMNKNIGEVWYAIANPTLDFEKRFSYDYSKIVGLNNSGNLDAELKFDYVEIDPSKDEQIFDIPGDRIVNEVLWSTDSRDVDKGTFGRYGGVYGLGMLPNGSYSYYGNPMSYMLPLYGILSAAQHNHQYNRIMRSELTYRIFAGKNEKGEKVRKLQLFPRPNSMYNPNNFNWRSAPTEKVFYWYYDRDFVNEKCPSVKNDYITSPSEVQIELMKWDDLNQSFKTKLRRLMEGKAKQLLGEIRGKFSGEISFGDAQRSLDYRMLFDEGKSLQEQIRNELNEYFTKFDIVNLMEERARTSDSLNQTLGRTAFKEPIMIF